MVVSFALEFATGRRACVHTADDLRSKLRSDLHDPCIGVREGTLEFDQDFILDQKLS